MSATATGEPARGDAPAAPSREARAGAAIAVATLTMAATSAIQAVLYLRSNGTTERTDAFFAALSLYTVFGVFCQSLRVTSVPLLVGERRRIRGRDFALTLAILAVPVVIATEVFAEPLAKVLAPGVNDAGHEVTRDGLRLLGIAMVTQLGAAGAATLLAVWGRFDSIAGAYILGSLSALVAYLIASRSADELSLGYSFAAMGCVTLIAMGVALQRARNRENPPGLAAPARLATEAALLLGRTLVYFVINGLFLITLAFASNAEAGDATVLSYGYLFASYLVLGTSVSVGISRVADMTRGAQEGEWKDVLTDTVPHGFRYAMLVCAPALAGLVAAGATIIGELFPDSLRPADVDTLQLFGALLALWTVAALLVNFLLPALFALGRARLVNLLAIPVLGLHVAATLVGESLWGVNGVVAAFCVAPLAFSVVLLFAGTGGHPGPIARTLLRDGLRFAGLAAGAYGFAYGVGQVLLDQGLARALVIGALGSALYLAGARVLAARELEVIFGARHAGTAA